MTKVWSVVLAAGHGRRLAPITQGTPKQFWSADGRPSLLDETLTRIAPLTTPARTTVVVDQSHRQFLRSAWPAARILYQPQDRGTAAGVLLALSPVLEQEPEAAVLLTPSDHAVADVRKFRVDIRDAVTAVVGRTAEIVLFGVEPSGAVSDYGWIAPGEPYGRGESHCLRRVAAFIEKPPADAAVRLFASRAVWNTMILVARASALLGLYEAHLPQLAEVLRSYRHLPLPRRQAFLTNEYPRLSVTDFSRHVPASAGNLALYIWPKTLGWSDLGTPDRLQAWLRLAPTSLSA